MDSEKILLALEERDRWKEREFELREEMKSLPRQEKRQKRQRVCNNLRDIAIRGHGRPPSLLALPDGRT